ncbi:MAG: HEAT repeat domain-containing protein [Gemmataceae bacterium]|nr:HEAT repeat domain-containing protein [Gemmataceae bacterium]
MPPLPRGRPRKINLREFNNYIERLTDPDPEVRWSSIRSLALYTCAEWEGTPDAVTATITAIVNFEGPPGSKDRNGMFRTEVAKALGNIGIHSTAVVPELLRILRDDADREVRAEAIRSLGKIGEGAKAASRALGTILKQDSEDSLRGEAVRALARVDPSAATTATLRAALDDASGHVGICAAEALWQVAHEPDEVVPALIVRLKQPASRHAATQVLYRMGPAAKAAIPALLAASKDKDRMFRESVAMALKKIDPNAAAKAGIK